MKKIVLIGGGGHCKSVIDSLKRCGEYEQIVITDPSLEAGTCILGCEVVGTDDSLILLKNKGFNYAFVTVGLIRINSLRKSLSDMIDNLGFEQPVVIDPSAIVSDCARIKRGTFIGKGAIINSDVCIGEGCIVNTGAIIEHDCKVRDFSHISVGTVLCGNVSIGENSCIGAGVTVIQGVNVGDFSLVGAGAVVNCDLPSNCLALGVPAKIIS